jgi:hypothetical protein
MLKRFGIPALALASVLAVAAPSFARGREDFRGGDRGGRDFDRHVVVRDRGYRPGFNFGVGVYADPVPVPVPVPAPVPSGYYDQYGIWHPYGY